MKQLFVTAFAVGLTSLLGVSSPVLADSLGTNITIYDNNPASTPVGTTIMDYTGVGIGLEDQETEPTTAHNNKWDLEGFFLQGTTLSMVGEWDFVNGEPGYTSGDLFIDTNDDTGSYEYVFDVDWLNGTYDLVKLDTNSTYESTTYIAASNPWKLANGASAFATGTFDETINNNLGFYGPLDHNVVSGFDLQAIIDDLGSSTSLNFTAHFTMQCGNDNLMGQGSAAPVPEPATMLLFGTGLAGLATFRRKQMKKA